MTINKKALRMLLLDLAAKNRAHHFSRVAPIVYQQAHAVIVQWAMRKIAEQPSKGKTIK